MEHNNDATMIFWDFLAPGGMFTAVHCKMPKNSGKH